MGYREVDCCEAVHRLVLTACEREVGGTESGGADNAAGSGSGVEQAAEAGSMLAGYRAGQVAEHAGERGAQAQPAHVHAGQPASRPSTPVPARSR